MTNPPNGTVKTKLKTQLRRWIGTKATVVCHNTPFDGYILTQYYRVRPKVLRRYCSNESRSLPDASARLKDCAIRAFPDDETMRKGEELADAKGIYDLDPELEESIAGYCIQDVDLTYAIYNAHVDRMPQSEMDLIRSHVPHVLRTKADRGPRTTNRVP